MRVKREGQKAHNQSRQDCAAQTCCLHSSFRLSSLFSFFQVSLPWKFQQRCWDLSRLHDRHISTFLLKLASCLLLYPKQAGLCHLARNVFIFFHGNSHQIIIKLSSNIIITLSSNIIIKISLLTTLWVTFLFNGHSVFLGMFQKFLDIFWRPL